METEKDCKLQSRTKEGDPFVRHTIQGQRRHSTTRSATIHAGITVSEVFRDDKDDVGFVCRRRGNDCILVTDEKKPDITVVAI